MAEEHSEGLSFHPMDQFIIKPLFGDGPIQWYTPTNTALWMAISIVGIILLLITTTKARAIVPGRGQSVAELLYGFVHKMVEDITGKEGLKYFPYVFTLFMFIGLSNFVGLIPGAFTSTTHIAVTAFLALAVFVSVTVIGFATNGMKFLGLFWISSAPLALRPILAILEIISYFVRPVSHSIRLAGNMMAGHAVMKVFAAFAPVILMSGVGVLVTPLSVIAIIGMYAFEVLVAFIQAYVFTILTCVYLKDALHPAH